MAEQVPDTFSAELISKGFVPQKGGGLRRKEVFIATRNSSRINTDKYGRVTYFASNKYDIVLDILKTDEEKRRQGKATEVLNDFIEAADKRGMTIWVEPFPIGNKVIMTKEQLWKFYEKFGFEKYDENIMVRKPIFCSFLKKAMAQ